MKRDVEMGIVIATEDVEKEGTSRDGNTNAGGESGAGEFGAEESGGVRECGEHRKAVLEMCKAQSRMHRAQQWGTMQEPPSETLWVFACAAKGGHGRQRWIVGDEPDFG